MLGYLLVISNGSNNENDDDNKKIYTTKISIGTSKYHIYIHDQLKRFSCLSVL